MEHTLAGHLDCLKERSLGVEVFGRDPQYDTKEIPIRRTLDRQFPPGNSPEQRPDRAPAVSPGRAQAAAEALGRISGPLAAKALQEALAKTKGAVRVAVADGGLFCAEGLMGQGDRKGAMILYDVLSRPDIPKAVRLAAMHSQIAAEVSLTRLRTAPPSQTPAAAPAKK